MHQSKMSLGEFYTGIALTACAATAVASSSAVILTALVFSDMMKSVFMRMIFFISLCDFIGSLSVTWGFPHYSSLICPVQGSFIYFFFRASWLWTTCLAYQIYSLVFNSNYGLFEYHMHIICWSISIILEFLPLSTNLYGQDDELSGQTLCYLRGGTKTTWVLAWSIAIFQVPLYICMIALSYFYIKVDRKHDSMFRSVANTLKLYPLAMIICWLPYSIFSLLVNFSFMPVNSLCIIVSNIMLALCMLSGTILSVIFFAQSNEARCRWYNLMFRKGEDTSQLVSYTSDFAMLESQDKLLSQLEHQSIDGLKSGFLQGLTRGLSSLRLNMDASTISSRSRSVSKASTKDGATNIGSNNYGVMIMAGSHHNECPSPIERNSLVELLISPQDFASTSQQRSGQQQSREFEPGASPPQF